MTQPTAISSPAEGQIPQTCRHHWVIQPAAGPLSHGVCQTCGEVREFKNSVSDVTWDDYNLLFRYRPGSWNDYNLSPGYRAGSVEGMLGLVDGHRKNDDEE